MESVEQDSDALRAVVSALDLGIFEQGADGGFSAVCPTPAWMTAFSHNTTFPFLGSFLDDARQFWAEPHETRLTWGPCAEMDDDGREFFFNVTALSFPTRKFLVFELDRSAAAIRDILQKAREQALSTPQADQTRYRTAISTDSTDRGLTRVVVGPTTFGLAATDVRQGAAAVHDVAVRLRDAGPDKASPEELRHLADTSALLLALVERLIAARTR